MVGISRSSKRALASWAILAGLSIVFWMSGASAMSETESKTTPNRAPEFFDAVYEDITSSINDEKERQWDIVKWAILSGGGILVFYHSDLLKEIHPPDVPVIFTILTGMVLPVIAAFSAYLLKRSSQDLDRGRERLLALCILLPRDELSYFLHVFPIGSLPDVARQYLNGTIRREMVVDTYRQLSVHSGKIPFAYTAFAWSPLLLFIIFLVIRLALRI